MDNISNKNGIHIVRPTNQIYVLEYHFDDMHNHLKY